MKKNKIISMASTLAMFITFSTFISATPKEDDVMTKEDGTYVVNTTTLGQDIIGYIGITPVKIYIKKNKVVKVEALKNEETPKYFAKVKKGLLDKWNGQKVNDAIKLKVDGVTGATISSDALIENVHLGLEYYKKNK